MATAEQRRSSAWLLALGVVFGDIGTSPLYAFKVAVSAAGGPSTANVLGIVSLIVWALLLSVSLKYVAFVLRADNDGEGGVFALVGLLDLVRPRKHGYSVYLVVALVGAAALFGDAVITPAISVISAVEGVKVALPVLDHLVLPITTIILVMLFVAQRYGTATIGMVFGPIMLLWFAALGLLGAVQLIENPTVLQALDPRHGFVLLARSPAVALAVLATVFLAITGGEALYADLGQVGRTAIRRAWYVVALPGLLLNYLGQGSLVLASPNEATEPFFHLAGSTLAIPLLVLATGAAIIASQAVLTGLFSLTHQAMRLGLLPPLKVVHNEAGNPHAIYVPALNGIVAVLTLGTAWGFGSADALAGAYGLAVVAAMVTTSVLFLVWYARRAGKTALFFVGVLMLSLDFAFVVPNSLKIADGGWLPAGLAVFAFVITFAWHRGRTHRLEAAGRGEALGQFARRMTAPDHTVLDRPTVFLAKPGVAAPHALRELERLFGLNFGRLIVVTLWPSNRPRIPGPEATETLMLGDHVVHVHLRIGYMQRVDLPSLLAPTFRQLGIEPRAVTYVTSFERVVLADDHHGPSFLDVLYMLLTRIAERAPDRFHLPASRTVEVGSPQQL